MLLNKSVEVLAFKLTSGEEVIAKSTMVDSDTYVLTDPLLMIMVPGEDDTGQGMVAFTPWMLGLAEHTDVRVSRHNVIAAVTARSDAAEQYNLIVTPPNTGNSLGGAENTRSNTGGKGK